MNWSRAKGILIALFIILDLFLLGFILFTRSTGSVEPEYKKNVLSYMESHGVTVECFIANVREQSGRLKYEEIRHDPLTFANALLGEEAALKKTEDPRLWVSDDTVMHLTTEGAIVLYSGKPSGLVGLPVPEEQAFTQHMEKWFRDKGLSDYEFVLDTRKKEFGLNADGDLVPDATSRTLIWLQTWKGNPLFKRSLSITWQGAVVRTIELTAAPVLKETAPGADAGVVISGYQILAMNASKIPYGSHLIDATLGYMPTQEGEWLESPVWRFQYAKGKEMYFSAYTGELLTAMQEEQ